MRGFNFPEQYTSDFGSPAARLRTRSDSATVSERFEPMITRNEDRGSE